MIWLRKSKNVWARTAGNVKATNMRVKLMGTSIIKRIWVICGEKWRN